LSVSQIKSRDRSGRYPVHGVSPLIARIAKGAETVYAIAVLLLLALPVLAIDIATLKPQGYVSDFAGVIDAQSKADLEAFSARVEKATGVEMAFVTLDSLAGESLEDFTNDLYRRWGVGKKGKDEGLLLLLVVNDRRSRLEIGRGLEEHIPDGMAGALLSEMRPFLRESQYGAAFSTAAHSLATRIAQRKGVQIPDAGPMRRRPPPQAVTDTIPIPLILGGIFLLFWIMGMGGRRGGRGGGGGLLPGIILGNMMGRSSYGGHSGGGFGGYDSGGGFGGFGGGDSGGGGASGSW
jgi:uncharacterized protein